MPFSMAAVQKHNRSILQFYKKIPYKKMKKIVTLLVHLYGNRPLCNRRYHDMLRQGLSYILCKLQPL